MTDRYLNGIPAGARATKTERVWLTPDDVNASIEKVRKLNVIAQQRGQKLSQMALAWVLRQPAVTSALVGASSVAQLEDNLGALNNLSFTGQELDSIEAILKIISGGSMGFFKKLEACFSAAPSADQVSYYIKVKCNRCGEEIQSARSICTTTSALNTMTPVTRAGIFAARSSSAASAATSPSTSA